MHLVIDQLFCDEINLTLDLKGKPDDFRRLVTPHSSRLEQAKAILEYAYLQLIDCDTIVIGHNAVKMTVYVMLRSKARNRDASRSP